MASAATIAAAASFGPGSDNVGDIDRIAAATQETINETKSPEVID
jgi:hypothetical protein